jgi:hypothetical protein
MKDGKAEGESGGAQPHSKMPARLHSLSKSNAGNHLA